MGGVFKILGISFLFFFMASCDRLKEGEVYEKEFKPGYTTTRLMPICVSNGKTVTTMLLPYIISYPDRWLVKIKKYNGKKWVWAEYYTTEEVYQTVNIGDEFRYMSGRDLLDEPYTRGKK